jgi:phage baseplate assembly protein gpV
MALSYVTRFDAERAAVAPVDKKSYGHKRQSLELTLGVIKEVSRKAHEVEVRLLLPENKKKNLWVSLPDPGVSSRHGSWLMPDEGEEVLIAFEHGDARRPFAVGGLWHGEEEPPETNEPTTSL